MKNKITLLVVLMCTTMIAVGQQSHKLSNPKWVKNQKIIGNIVRATKDVQLNKGRAADERVIADAYEESSIDSTTYSYSGSRGCQLDKEFGVSIDNIDYDQMTYYSLTMPATLDSKSIRTYNGNNQVMVQIDSTHNGTSWDATNRTTNTYNGSNQLSSSLVEWWTGNSWANSYKTDYTYAGANQLSAISQIWNSTAWENSYKVENVFTGSNITEQTSSFWNNSMWEGQLKSTYTYNGNNQILSEIQQIFNAPTWENSMKTINTYNSTSNKIEKIEMQAWANNLWLNNVKIDITWVSNTLITALIDSWNGISWDKEQRVTLTFNALGYPTTDISESWNGTSYAFDPSNDDYKERYYYESYNNNVGVQNVASAVFGLVNIFPNPTSDMVNIEITKATNSNKEIIVMDMMGKIISQSTLNKLSQSAKINLSGLTAGNYFVQIKDESGYKFTSKIVKQ